jgi:hypothetical protein
MTPNRPVYIHMLGARTRSANTYAGKPVGPLGDLQDDRVCAASSTCPGLIAAAVVSLSELERPLPCCGSGSHARADGLNVTCWSIGLYA